MNFLNNITTRLSRTISGNWQTVPDDLQDFEVVEMSVGDVVDAVETI